MMIHLKSIDDLYRIYQLGCAKHPLVAVLDFNKVSTQMPPGTKIMTDFYSVMIKNYSKNLLKYGRRDIDFQDGSLMCMAPNQVLEMDAEVEAREDMMGWGLFFHPDLIRGTGLQDQIDHHGYFSYQVAEALHLSDKEKNILVDCIVNIDKELDENIDSYSKSILVSKIDLLLNYCSRFYGRQLITRSQNNQSVVAKIENLLQEHFRSDRACEKPWPTVSYLAEMVCLSPSYLSDLLKAETGRTTQEHIHYYLIESAKNILLSTDKSVNEIAFHLGFAHPNYFNRLFKDKTGKTPIQFRQMS